MSWTKEDVIKKAFSEIGLASYVFSMTAEERQDALEMLDSMMAVWSKKGIVFDPVYPQPVSISDGDIKNATNAPAEANKAMYLNLAIDIAPGYGKTPSTHTIRMASSTFSQLLGDSMVIPEISLKGAIKGAGAKQPLSPFIVV